MAALLVLATTAAAATISAHGSVNQVYATGVKAGAKVSLLNAAGKLAASHKADSLGGVVFRNVKAGSGYRVRQGSKRSGSLTVLPDVSKPPRTKGYNQTIPSKGYG